MDVYKQVAWALSLVCVVILTSGYVEAARLYQWKDASGLSHFTDNPANVPAKYRSGSRDIGSVQVVGSKGHKITGRVNAREAWQKRCASCHVTGEQDVGSLRGLGMTARDPETRMLYTPEALLPILRSAVSGRTTDMKAMDIGDEELLAIARYLIDSQR